MTKHNIKINVYHVVSEAVDVGVSCGYNRAHKHTDTPSEELLRQEIYNAIMNELCEVLDFGSE